MASHQKTYWKDQAKIKLVLQLGNTKRTDTRLFGSNMQINQIFSEFGVG